MNTRKMLKTRDLLEIMSCSYNTLTTTHFDLFSQGRKVNGKRHWTGKMLTKYQEQELGFSPNDFE